jgi:ectoine hydroxylase-related dioxygenase (phytanoyl-CoA dioxygenase family)
MACLASSTGENRFSPADVSSADFGQALEQDGYVIIEDVLSADELLELNAQISGQLASTMPDYGNAFMGEKTKRFGRLLYRIPASREIVRHPFVLSVLNSTLRLFSPTYQVHFTSVMHVMEGEKAQVLHRDISPFPNQGPTVVIATMWAASAFTRDNGATVLVPGSHLWPDARFPTKEELRVAEMRAGSLLIYRGNLIHGAGACKRGSRTGVALQYCVGWMRQEENQYLAVPLEVARTLPEDLQRIMGYDLAARHWGYVDQLHPLNFLHETDRYGGLDPDGYQFPGQVVALRAVPDGIHIDHRYPITLDD